MVRVIDIKSNKIVYTHISGTSRLYDMEFSPIGDTFAISGMKTIKFYFSDEGNGYKDNKGILGPAIKEISAFTSVSFTKEGNALVTNAKGSLLYFKDRTCVKCVKLHKGAIYSSFVDEDGVIFTGDRDGYVRTTDGR